MIALFAALLLAAAPPSPVPIAGLRVLPAVSVAGQPGLNARQTDLNDDGHAELLFPAHLLRWPYGEDDRLAYPDAASDARVDVWQDRLYILAPELLTQFRLDNVGTWIEEKSWGVTAPDGTLNVRDQVPATDAFLYDMESDGLPEIVLSATDGLWVLTLDGEGRYTATAPFAVWPAMVAPPARDQTVWPTETRRLPIAGQAGRYRVLLEGATALVLTRSTAADARVKFANAVFPWGETESPWSARSFPAMPSAFQPCRLNTAPELHFAAGRWLKASASTLPMPIYESAVSLDGGKSFARRRVRALQQGGVRVNFIDIDGDGDRDWVLTEPTTFDRGARDALSQFLTRDTLDIRLRIYFQNAGSFSENADITVATQLALGMAPVRGGTRYRHYLDGQSILLGGDINGDGWKDLLVRRDARHLDIHHAQDGSYPDRPTGTLDLEPEDSVAVFDVDADGTADIVRRAPATDSEIALVHFMTGVWP